MIKVTLWLTINVYFYLSLEGGSGWLGVMWVGGGGGPDHPLSRYHCTIMWLSLLAINCLFLADHIFSLILIVISICLRKMVNCVLHYFIESLHCNGLFHSRSLATGNNERFEKLIFSILPGLTKSLNENQSKAIYPQPLLAASIYNILATMRFGKQ